MVYINTGAMLSMQKHKHHSDLEPAKRLFDKMLPKGNLVSPRNLEIISEYPKEKNEHLRETLTRIGALSEADIEQELSLQKKIIPSGNLFKTRTTNCGLPIRHFLKTKRATSSTLECLRLGEILLSTGHITKQQLEEVLILQKVSKKKIGELLIEAGYLQCRQLDCGLKLQKRFVTVALISLLSLANVLGIHKDSNASTSALASTKINVSATVLERTTMRILNQIQQVVITNKNVQQGYVDIPAASSIAVKSNNPRGYLLMFEVMSDPINNFFHTITVVMGGKEVQLSPNGGHIPQPYIRGGATTDISYRFSLSKDVQPGTYNWPLMVSVSSI
jgi:hypothetical protein